MKTTLSVLLISIVIGSYGQIKRKASRVNLPLKASTVPGQASQQIVPADDSSYALRPGQTMTDRYLNGPQRKRVSAATNATTSASTSPFAGGIHPADNAAKTFDTIAANRNYSAHNQNGSNQTASSQAENNQIVNTTVRGGNDTTFNINTISSSGRVTTSSGAVDRSGQAQFGQTNWGTSRSTVGESQWTVPPPITASFNKDFPSSNSATWTRNNVDTTIYSARYKSGAQWVITNYNATGQRLEMRTEFPILQPPAAVSVYMAKQPAGFRAATIYKLQVLGRPDLYEIETSAGKKIYINSDGMEVNY